MEERFGAADRAVATACGSCGGFGRRRRCEVVSSRKDFSSTAVSSSKPAFRQPTERKGPEGDPLQPHHLVSHAGEQASDFAVLAMIQADFEERTIPLRSDAANPLETKSSFVKKHSLFEGGDGLRRRPPGHLDRVRPPDLEPRMGQPVSQLAVVGDED